MGPKDRALKDIVRRDFPEGEKGYKYSKPGDVEQIAGKWGIDYNYKRKEKGNARRQKKEG